MKSTVLSFSLILLSANSVVCKNTLIKRVLLAAALGLAIIACTGALGYE